MITLVCYGCEGVERDCCGGGVTDECFSGLAIDDGDINLIYSPFNVFVNASGAASGVVVSDFRGNYYSIPVSGTSYASLSELQEHVEKCKCGGIFKQEWYGVTGTSLTFTENSGHIPGDRDKYHLLIDGREKRQGEYSVSGSNINTTFNIYADNRVIFWYQLS